MSTPSRPYRVCTECGQTYDTAADLLAARNMLTADVGLPPSAQARQIYSCPMCTVDFLAPAPDRDREHPLGPAGTPAGVWGFYTVAVMSMLVSVDTSWRYFAQNLHITDLRERIVMFAVIEVALVACGYGMRANVIRTGRPGAPRLFAWILCGMAGYMAWQLSGVAEGIARVALGPVLGLVMLHLALGIEIRAGRHTATTWARIGRELRERVLSRMGLADDARDALARTRDRAARRAARLALAPKWTPFRQSRLNRNIRRSDVADDLSRRARMLAELAAIRHAGDLTRLAQPSPWHDSPAPGMDTSGGVHTPTAETSPRPSTGRPVNAATNRTVNLTMHGAVNGQRTPTPPDANTPTAGVSERRPRGTANGRASVRKPRARRKLADYLAEARQRLTPEVTITPAWVREVIPGCPRSTSKNVADALKAQGQHDGTEVTE